MKQRLKDYALLIKKDRKTQLITGLIAFLGLGLLFSAPAPKKAKPKKKQEIGVGTIAKGEAANDIVAAFENRVEGLEVKQEELQKGMTDFQKQFTDYEGRTAAILQKMLERISVGESNEASAVQDVSVKPIELSDEPGMDGSGGGGNGGGVSGDELEPFGLEESAPVPPPIPPKQKLAFIGKGDAVRLKLIAGVNAPTDGTPYPVLFKVIGNVSGPDGTSLPIGEARVIAAAQGNLSDARALFRLTDLSIRMPNGERKEYKIDGWVVGEDGIRGMSGRLIDHLGELIGVSMVTGAAQGVAKGLAAGETTTTVSDEGTSNTYLTGDTTTFALAKAAEGGIKDFTEVIKQRAQQLVPHVEVLSGREATAVFAKSVVLDGLYDQIEDGEAFDSSLD